MSTGTNIEWTDTTWNPCVGCTPVSPGCLNCYAATMAGRLEAMGQTPYVGLTVKKVEMRQPMGPRGKRLIGHDVRRRVFNGTVRCLPERLEEPLKWRKPRRVFVNSMSDLFHEAVPDDFIDRVLETIARSPHHTFQVLTKRPERMAAYFRAAQAMVPRRSFGHSMIWPNLWLGTSCEHQAAADERIPHLLKCPAAVRFLSCEPLLGAIDLRCPKIEWIHPERGDDGRRAMERIGVGVGDEFLQAHAAGWEMPEEITSRRSGDGLWQRGRVRVHHATRHRLAGWYAPKYGAADRGCVECDDGYIQSPNVVIGQLRVSNIAGDPELVFPIAKAPPRGIDWVIVGGESGANARPCNLAWVRSIVEQCKAAGVPCFVKQLGARPQMDAGEQIRFVNAGLADSGKRDPKGGDPAEWPADLRVRQFPATPGARA